MPYAPEYLHLVIPGVKFEAYLYGRNSINDFAGIEGARDSIDDQLATGRDLCNRHTWPVIHEFKDSDLSASRHARKTRDDFEDLITAITKDAAPAGVRRIVVAYEASRYYRDLDAYLRLRNACTASNTLLCYNGQVYDLSRPDDRKATAQHAIDAEAEADSIQARNLLTANLQAQAGKPHGRLTFGYLREYAVVGGRQRCIRQYEDPVRGPIVVKALKHIDSGLSARSLLLWMNSTPEAARPDGAPWMARSLRVMLLNRAYIGERTHNGTHLKGTWEPLRGLDTPQGRALFNRVTARLTDPGRRSSRGTAVSHLLTYLAMCGECGDHALLCWQSHGPTRLGSLSCEPKKDVSMAEAVVNAFVEEAVIAWFSNKQAARAALVPNEEDLGDKMASIQRLIDGYEEQLAEARELAETLNPDTGRPRLTIASLASLEERIQPKLDAERAKLPRLTGVSPVLLRMLEAKDPQAEWNGEDGAPGLPLELKREIIRNVVTVRLYKSTTRGSTKPDLRRIRLAFVGEPGFTARPPRVPRVGFAPPAAGALAQERAAAAGTG